MKQLVLVSRAPGGTQPAMQGKVYIHGQICAPEAAQISVFDRGFLYGDSVFETLRVYHGKPFALTEHLERLFASGERVGFVPPWSRAHIEDVVLRTIAATGMDALYVRIIATRGAGPLALDPSAAEDPTLIVMAVELPPLPAAMYAQGKTGWLVSVLRSGDPQAKTGNYLNSIMAAREARAHGADEAIMLNHAGRVTEASAANVFARIHGVWCTPPLDVGILSGITRKTIIELCRSQGVAVEERVLWPDDLLSAEEIFLCASVREIVPVVQLNSKPVGSGQVGPATASVRAAYRAEVERRTAQ